MSNIKIKRNTNGDSRVAKKVPTFYEFEQSNRMHMEDVEKALTEISKYISDRGKHHDWSKRNEPYRSMFYRDLCNTIEGKMDFMNGEWSKFHYETERHHLLRNVPEDVNLIDVIEMIADCVCAGMARSGEVRPLEIDEKILVTAMNNTVKMLADAIEVDDE